MIVMMIMMMIMLLIIMIIVMIMVIIITIDDADNCNDNDDCMLHDLRYDIMKILFGFKASSIHSVKLTGNPKRFDVDLSIMKTRWEKVICIDF